MAKHYLLFYEVGDDYVSRRAAFRDSHLEQAWKASDRGELLLGGALAKPMDGAVLLFKAESPEVAENFAKHDPYITSGAVKRWYVREWTTVAGELASDPVKPEKTRVEKNGMILRMWKGQANAEKADEYVQHVKRTVFPKLQCIEGFGEAYLLRHPINGAMEFVVLTLWDSMKAVRRFAGEDADEAVVETEARSALGGFDDFVTHFEVVHRAANKSSCPNP